MSAVDSASRGRRARCGGAGRPRPARRGHGHRAGDLGDRTDRAAEPGPQRGDHPDVSSRRWPRRRHRNATGPLSGVPYPGQGPDHRGRRGPVQRGLALPARHRLHRDSELVRRLRRAGLIILGKTNTPEFGMAPTCEPVAVRPDPQPVGHRPSTSGSSGGSAAAVASRMVPMAHGNDLGGSLRYPASACGLFGLKPTRARNPLGPEYGDAVGGWAVRARADPVGARQRRAPRRHRRARRSAIPYRRAARGPAVRRGGRRRPRSAAHRLHRPHPRGVAGHPDCVAAARRRRPRCAHRLATT